MKSMKSEIIAVIGSQREGLHRAFLVFKGGKTKLVRAKTKEELSKMLEPYELGKSQFCRTNVLVKSLGQAV